MIRNSLHIFLYYVLERIHNEEPRSLYSSPSTILLEKYPNFFFLRNLVNFNETRLH